MKTIELREDDYSWTIEMPTDYPVDKIKSLLEIKCSGWPFDKETGQVYGHPMCRVIGIEKLNG